MGKALDPHDRGVFHQLSLIAFFAWVGLGADGLSSTCYGPSEAYLALGAHPHLSVFVALATAITIGVISASYSQIIELFPAGGGGYVVASKLLSPSLGMVSGCALLIDYVLTIAISVASGADAVFSFLPASMQSFKLIISVLGVLVLTMMNLRGVKESVVPLVPIFMVFVVTHAFALIYAIVSHAPQMVPLVTSTAQDFTATRMELGWLGLFALLLKAYGMGAGTYTGIEAVSNSLPILREPKVQTAKSTMRYMAWSLGITAAGLLIAYLLYGVQHQEGKTLNAVLLEGITAHWPDRWGYWFVLITLISETAILFIAAQSGFLSGPRVLANMAVDRWVPTRFASLSDRLVTHNGIVLMGGSALVTILLTGGNVGFLVVLYSINVFITFALSQMGMVRYAWGKRAEAPWPAKLRLNTFALFLTLFILVTMTVTKFHEGGWITLAVTGALVALVSCVKLYYNRTGEQLKRLDSLVEAADISDLDEPKPDAVPAVFDPNAKTAIIMVSGFNGMGLHTLFAVKRLFGELYRNYVFIQIGLVDAGNFKGASELDHLHAHVETQLDRYVNFMRRRGYYAERQYAVGVDALDEIGQLAPALMKKYKQAVFFGGQLAFTEDVVYSRWLHNYLVFAVQAKLHNMGIPFVILPIRVQTKPRKTVAATA